MTKLVWRANGVSVKEYVLHPGMNRVGRSATSDVRIDDSTISGQHCELWVHEEALIVRDLGSTNGTFVDGRRVTESEIRWGQSLRLGGIEFVVSEPPARVAIPAAPAPCLPAPTFLADGITPCCPAHPESAALYRCLQCGSRWCPQCVRVLQRIGGKVMVFCGECGGASEPLTPETPERPRVRVVYWMDRLADSFRPRPKYPTRKRRKS